MDLVRYLDLAPDLVAEVVSPSDTASQLNTKVLEYLQSGSRLVWVVYPDSQSVEVHRPDGSSQILQSGDVLSGEATLPGFSINVAELFATPDDA